MHATVHSVGLRKIAGTFLTLHARKVLAMSQHAELALLGEPQVFFLSVVEGAKDDDVDMVGLIGRLIDAAKAALGSIDVDRVVATLKTVWESTVVPYNWPSIPDFIEVRLETAAWTIIENGIRRFAARRARRLGS